MGQRVTPRTVYHRHSKSVVLSHVKNCGWRVVRFAVPTDWYLDSETYYFTHVKSIPCQHKRLCVERSKDTGYVTSVESGSQKYV